jgi:hypothetical protein
MFNISLDNEEKKYYITKNNIKTYINTGYIVTIQYNNINIKGIICYNKIIKGGYFVYFNDNFIPLFTLNKLNLGEKFKNE